MVPPCACFRMVFFKGGTGSWIVPSKLSIFPIIPHPDPSFIHPQNTPTIGSPKKHRNTSEKNGIRIQVWVQTWKWMKMDENGGCFPTFNLPKILSSQVSWDSEPCRLWAFGVRGWIPFELRSNRWDDWSSRAPAPGGKFQGKTSFF